MANKPPQSFLDLAASQSVRPIDWRSRFDAVPEEEPYEGPVMRAPRQGDRTMDTVEKAQRDMASDVYQSAALAPLGMGKGTAIGKAYDVGGGYYDNPFPGVDPVMLAEAVEGGAALPLLIKAVPVAVKAAGQTSIARYIRQLAADESSGRMFQGMPDNQIDDMATQIANQHAQETARAATMATQSRLGVKLGRGPTDKLTEIADPMYDPVITARPRTNREAELIRRAREQDAMGHAIDGETVDGFFALPSARTEVELNEYLIQAFERQIDDVARRGGDADWRTHYAKENADRDVLLKYADPDESLYTATAPQASPERSQAIGPPSDPTAPQPDILPNPIHAEMKMKFQDDLGGSPGIRGERRLMGGSEGTYAWQFDPEWDDLLREYPTEVMQEGVDDIILQYRRDLEIGNTPTYKEDFMLLGDRAEGVVPVDDLNQWGGVLDEQIAMVDEELAAIASGDLSNPAHPDYYFPGENMTGRDMSEAEAFANRPPFTAEELRQRRINYEEGEADLALLEEGARTDPRMPPTDPRNKQLEEISDELLQQDVTSGHPVPSPRFSSDVTWGKFADRKQALRDEARGLERGRVPGEAPPQRRMDDTDPIGPEPQGRTYPSSKDPVVLADPTTAVPAPPPTRSGLTTPIPLDELPPAATSRLLGLADEILKLEFTHGNKGNWPDEAILQYHDLRSDWYNTAQNAGYSPGNAVWPDRSVDSAAVNRVTAIDDPDPAVSDAPGMGWPKNPASDVSVSTLPPANRNAYHTIQQELDAGLQSDPAQALANFAGELILSWRQGADDIDSLHRALDMIEGKIRFESNIPVEQQRAYLEAFHQRVQLGLDDPEAFDALDIITEGVRNQTPLDIPMPRNIRDFPGARDDVVGSPMSEVTRDSMIDATTSRQPGRDVPDESDPAAGFVDKLSGADDMEAEFADYLKTVGEETKVDLDKGWMPDDPGLRDLIEEYGMDPRTPFNLADEAYAALDISQRKAVLAQIDDLSRQGQASLYLNTMKRLAGEDSLGLEMSMKDAYLLQQLVVRLGPDFTDDLVIGLAKVPANKAMKEMTINAVARVDENLLDSVKALMKRTTIDSVSRQHFNLLLEASKEASKAGRFDDADSILMFLDNWQTKLKD
jgi:hypothetical protein